MVYHNCHKFFGHLEHNIIIILNFDQVKFSFQELVCQKVSGSMANSEDPDQTAPFRSSLIRVCTVCIGTSILVFRAISV